MRTRAISRCKLISHNGWLFPINRWCLRIVQPDGMRQFSMIMKDFHYFWLWYIFHKYWCVLHPECTMILYNVYSFALLCRILFVWLMFNILYDFKYSLISSSLNELMIILDKSWSIRWERFHMYMGQRHSCDMTLNVLQKYVISNWNWNLALFW